MSNLGNSLSTNILSMIKNLGKIGKNIFQSQKTNEPVFKENKPSLDIKLNATANSQINQSILSSPSLNQAALNTSKIQQTILQQDIKNIINPKIEATSGQAEFQGATDLPAYLGIANMSLKSWIAEHDNKVPQKLIQEGKQLLATLDGIKGFQKENYKDYEDSPGKPGKRQSLAKSSMKPKKLVFLNGIFSTMATLEQSGSQETDLLVKILNFKKLGSFPGNKGDDSLKDESKLSPPTPSEPQKLGINTSRVKYLHSLIALPSEFPECLRLFAKENVEINPRDLNNFLKHRFQIVQEQLLGVESPLNNVLANFVPLINQNDYSLILPLVLLYYPLPLPYIREKSNFLEEWGKNNDEKNELMEPLIASCEIFYVSKSKERFLIRLELTQKHELNFDIQTSQRNKTIVNDLELAIAESMFLMENPPLLSDLNVLLTGEIYKATDLDEELAIISVGPLRLEIVLATYAVLVILNKLSPDYDPRGLIDIGL